MCFPLTMNHNTSFSTKWTGNLSINTRTRVNLINTVAMETW